MGVLGKIGKVASNALGSITGGDILGLGASLFNTGMNAQSQREANEATARLWREQAFYNKPINQMARYQEAGLNPNLMYSQGNPGNMTSSPTMQPVRYDFDPNKQFVLSATRQNLVAQNDNLHQQNTLLQNQGSLAAEQARKMKLENDFFEKNGYYPGNELPWARTVKTLWNYITGLPEVFNDETGRQSRGALPPRGRVVQSGDRYYPVGH